MHIKALQLSYDQAPGLGVFVEIAVNVNLRSFLADGLRPLADDWRQALLKTETAVGVAQPSFNGWEVGEDSGCSSLVLYQTLDHLAEGLNNKVLRPIGTTIRTLGLTSARRSLVSANHLKNNPGLLKSLALLPAFHVKALKDNFTGATTAVGQKQTLMQKVHDEGWNGQIQAAFLPVAVRLPSGTVLRRAQWVGRFAQSDRWRNASPHPFLYFDGTELHHLKTLDNLPDPVTDDFDKAGLATIADQRDLVVSPHWEAAYVLSLQAQEEAPSSVETEEPEPPREYLGLKPLNGFSSVTPSQKCADVPEAIAVQVRRRYAAKDLDRITSGIYRDGDILLCRRCVPGRRAFVRGTVVRQLPLHWEQP